MKKFICILLIGLMMSPAMSKEANSLSDGESLVSINGIKHWVKVKGVHNNTVPIIVLHGGPGGNNYVFERTVGPLLEDFSTIVYYEQRGCGRSMPAQDPNDYQLPTLIEDLDRLITTLGFEKATLLGYSFGAELAARYAKKYPNKVERLILSAPAELSTSTSLIQIQGFYSISNPEQRLEIEGILAKPTTADQKISEIWGMASEQEADRFLFENQEIAKLNRQFWRESNLPSRGSYDFKKVILATRKGDLIETVQDLKTPTLIITGVHDRNGGFHTAKALSKVLPNSQLKMYLQSAHFPDLEESKRFTNDVKGFVLK